ncbi:MAG: lytic transglycosylase domain-containing protein [Bacteroidota bacterium]|nr:lytic transglycosylase domain-containing protein [Bacteroidota bacterium]
MGNVLKKLKKFFLHPNFRNTVFVFFSIVLLSVLLHLFSYAFSNDQDQKYEDYTNSNYRVFGLNIPKNLNFAGERVPQTDFSIKESLDREFLTNTYWQSNAMLLFKRANRWFPIIEPILKKNNVPDDFKYVALIESHLSNAVSPRGATGFWQFVEETGTHYGLEINDEVDERYNVEKSTQAACMYFKDAHKKFGDWTLAAASYNLGMGGIETQLKKQKVTNYYDLMLNEETGRYVYRLLALKTILQNPKQFGFEIRKKDLYHRIPTISVKVNESIPDLVEYSISKGYNYKILKLFNPWLRDSSLKNPEKKIYIIQFPKKEYMQRAFDEIELDSLKNSLHLDSTAFASPGDTTKLY